MKKKKVEYIDDGHTIYNMNVDGMPGYRPTNEKKDIYITKEEKRLLIKSAFRHYLPIVFGTIFCFFLAMLLIYWWLS